LSNNICQQQVQIRTNFISFYIALASFNLLSGPNVFLTSSQLILDHYIAPAEKIIAHSSGLRVAHSEEAENAF